MSQDMHQRELSSREKRALLASLLRDRAHKARTSGPLSHGQKALWLLHRRAPENAAYNTALAVRVRSEVDTDALCAALQTLVDRHAALRTTFEAEEGKPVAVVHGRRDIAFAQHDAGGWSDEKLDRRVAEDYRRPFDLERGPLMRASLFSRGAADHLLMLGFHHIICDAWSMWMLMHELSVLYPAALAGRPAELPPAAAQYPDFVQWQNRLLAGPEGERLWQYWREKLSGELPVLDLPTDRPRPPAQSLRGASHFFQIDGDLAENLLEVGKTQGVTLYICLLTVFQTLLHRYSGQDDIIVGSPVAGRNNPDMATAVGYFANPLPMRADLSGNPGFRELLSQIRHTVLEALTHQDLPFPLLVERLQPKRDPSRWPVMEVMFVLQRPPTSEQFLDLLAGDTAGGVRWGGLDLQPFCLAQMEGQFDLTLEVVEGQRALSCVLKYNPDLFECDTIVRMEGHLKTLIQAVIDNPEQRIGHLPMMAAAERRQVLEEWQRTETAYPLERCLHHWIEDQADRTPEQTAVVMADAGGAALTYGELNARANRLAHHLETLGVGPESVVGVLAERSLELVVALLGVLKAGAAYLPLDPEYPRRRLAFMIEDAKAAALLIQERLAERLPPAASPVVRLDADWPAIAQQDAADRSAAVGPENLAYVIYTSGSTGQPKGAENTHRAICNRLLWMQDEYRLNGSDRVLQKTPFSFDVSVWEFFWPLMTGATLVMARPGSHRARDDLVETIVSQGVTTLHFVPSMLHVFLDAPSLSRCRETLRRVFCSGEALPRELQQRFFERLDVALYNLYGPTEAAVDVTHWRCRRDSSLRTVPIGRPIANTRIYLLDKHLQPVPVGVPGELHIGGVGLARGYRNRPELTADKFIQDPVSRRTGETLYRTGDLCRWLPDGNIEYLQRIDFQVKVRGFRIELGEIESALSAHPGVREAVVRVERPVGDVRLLAWLVPEAGARPGAGELRRFLKDRLPEYMIPAGFVFLDALPLSPNGKVDRSALPAPEPARPDPAGAVPPRTAAERSIADIWRQLLRLEEPGIHDNFFDLGGHSLLLAEVQTRLTEAFGKAPSMVEMFQFPTIHALAGFYAEPDAGQRPALPAGTAPAGTADIAIIGLAGRFPGATDVETLWRNLREGVESITFFDDQWLTAAGVSPELLRDPNYVKAFGALVGIEEFDAGFFGFTPREAELMDVQHRLLLECAWEALEHAGHDPEAENRRYGVLAGVGMNRYLLNNLLPHRALMETADAYQLMLGNDKDFAPTRMSYKLNLKGPSVSVQTACSTSLVAVHLACRSLLAGDCDTALAGGCSVTLPQDRGYLYREGMILSPDGHCRAFDGAARGTVGGNGVGLVVLKRLDEALADGDSVYAVIKGSAINNDGSLKAGYTAPGVAGQAAVIAAAQAVAGVEPDTIGYIEAHGTGTPLGDPIEIAALTQVFRAKTERTGYCAIGSAKTNLGHLDSAAGVTGLIKAALAVKYGLVPPSLHFREPNPELKLAESPFFVPTELRPWPAGAGPRRAGVSSFGIGGTNAHVVLEEAPEPAPSGPGRSWQLLVLSARQPAALDAAAERLARHLSRNHYVTLGDVTLADVTLADVAFTLGAGRRAFGQRRMLVCRTAQDAAAALAGERPAGRVYAAAGEAAAPSVAFMFPGQGAQHVGMAAELYRGEAVFREQVDRCAALLEPQLKLDLRELLYPTNGQAPAGDERLKQSAIAQPALFAVEYALARSWMSWGILAEALIGHSVGEYVAACLAGVWSLEDALALVALRAGLMQRQPGGAMLAVSLSERELGDWLGSELSLAAVNGPGSCVASGPHPAIADLARRLAARDIACRSLQTSHAFHSAMMEPVLEPFLARLREVEFHPPAIPFVSNLTGAWIESAQATDPGYWARHLRHAVRFADGLDTLLREPGRCLIEVGPGNTVGTLALRHPRRSDRQTVVTSLRRPHDEESDIAHLLDAVGKVWVAGASLDWPAFYAGQQRRRVPLPSYPFQRQRYWIDPPAPGEQPDPDEAGTAERKDDIGDWCYVPSWQRTPPPVGVAVPGTRWLVFVDDGGVGAALVERLALLGIRAVRVHVGTGFARRAAGEFALDPAERGGYGLLPRRRLQRWHPELVVLLDFCPRLWPYREDMHRLAGRLLRHCGRSGVSLRIVNDGPLGPWSDWVAHQNRRSGAEPPLRPWVMPLAGTPVLIVSDLGLLLGSESAPCRNWARFIADLVRAQVRPVALAPLSARQLDAALGVALPILRWSPDARVRPVRAYGPGQPEPEGLDELLAMVAATRRVDPPLLRALRRLNPRDPLDAGLEGALWCHADVESGLSAVIRPEAHPAHLRRFAERLPQLHAQLNTLRSRHHSHLRAVLNHEENLLWTLDPAATEAARDFMRRLAATLTAPGSGQSAGVWWGVAQGIVQRTDNAMGLRHSGVLHPLLAALVRIQGGQAKVPAWADPVVLKGLLHDPQGPTRCWLVRDAASGCLLLQAEPPGARQSPLGQPLLLDAGGARVSVGEGAGAMTRWLSTAALPVPLARLGDPTPMQILTAREAITLAAVRRPRGALGWGCDRSGIAVQSPALGPHTMPWADDALRAAPVPAAASPTWALEAEVPVPLMSPLSQAAVRFGIDTSFGVYADLTVTTPDGHATQRLRWIEPGSFLMGSRADEPERYDDEGPRHTVTLTRGFWLADTACTQALWHAVMGTTPSYFSRYDERHPVEQVSWNAVQRFLRELKAL